MTGEAMGTVTVCARVETPAGIVARALARERLLAAIVEDEWGRLAGVVERPDVEAAPAKECLQGIVRIVSPVHEATPPATVIARMVHDRARALPVVDDDGRLSARARAARAKELPVRIEARPHARLGENLLLLEVLARHGRPAGEQWVDVGEESSARPR